MPVQNPYLIILPFLLLGLALFAIQLAAIFFLLQPYRRGREESSGTVPQSMFPPSDLSPAEAGFLLESGSRVGWDPAFGCLLDLAARGMVFIESIQRRKERYATGEYILRLVGDPAHLRPFERGLLEAVFLSESVLENTVRLNLAYSRYSARFRRFARPLLVTLRRKGLVEPGRENAQMYLRWMARFAGLAGGAGLVIGLWFALTRGLWAVLLIPAGFLAGALVAHLQASSFSVLTELGQETADRWRAYAFSISQAGQEGLLSGGEEAFEKQLAYLAGFGLLQAWLRHRQPGWPAPKPGWFGSASAQSHGSDAFLDFLSSSADLSGERAVFHPDQPDTD